MSELLDDPDPDHPHLQVALDHHSNVLCLEEPLVKDAVKGMSQRGLSLRVDNFLRESLSQRADNARDQTRLASLSLAHTGDWLNVVPCAALGLQLRAAEFRVAVLYRLGMPIFQTDGPCVGCDLVRSDRHADHAISCARQGERISRHNHLRDALYNAAVSAQLGPTREDRALLPLAAEGARPADVYIPLWAPGSRDAALDVTVVSPFQLATFEREAREPGYALRMRWQQKWSKYGEACKAEGITFMPMVVSTLGAWEEGAAQVIKRLAKGVVRANGQEDVEVIKHLFGKLSILLQRDNAGLVLNRVPSHPEPTITGDL